MAIYQLGEIRPDIHPSAYVAPSAQVIGDVRMAQGSSLWFGAVARGDSETITIGQGSNVQDLSVLHADPGIPLLIGDGVTIGHKAMLHGCTIGDHSLVGIGAIVLNGAKIGKNSLVGAGSLITEGKVFADNALILGAPAKVVKTLSDEQMARLRAVAWHYRDNGARFAQALRQIA